MGDTRMIESLEIRDSTSGDVEALEALYPEVFPEEDLLPVVRDLLQEEANVISLVATLGDTVVGHVIFTICGPEQDADKAALLGPLGVAPAQQKQGMGSKLIAAGVQTLEAAGVTDVYVLGDPNYYGRSGFVMETRVMPPYPLPVEWREAWQSRRLTREAPMLEGTLSLPRPWYREELWTE